jgi:cytochrome c oxidase cbb3-type subunit 3
VFRFRGRRAIGSAFLLTTLFLGGGEAVADNTATRASRSATGVARSAGDPVRGGEDYATYCAACHGATGNGDGPMAAMMDRKPARHADGAHMNTLSDDFLFRIIRDGGPALGKSDMMTAWGGTLSEEQIRGLVAYIRTLAR